MLPTIGIMGGIYMVIRLLSLMLRGGYRAENPVVRVFAGVSCVAILALMADLLIAGTQ